ncbi:DUF4981 domain-containing protein [Lachnospiraceae bacterium OttesenSCG-928-D06]|nr:DUF4981 domain-containing protein [Lachnospiraceae bacterium OttesenSCG-928-D06]
MPWSPETPVLYRTVFTLIAPNGKTFEGYSGDFGEAFLSTPDPLFMCCNGIVLPDLTFKPVAYHVKQCYCPIRIEKIDYDNAWIINPGMKRLQISNRNLYMDTDSYEFFYVIKENGQPIAKEEWKVPLILPGETKEFAFEPEVTYRDNCEYYVDFIVKQGSDEIGRYQFELEQGSVFGQQRTGKNKPPVSIQSEAFVITEEENLLSIVGHLGYLSINKTDGSILAYGKTKKDVVLSGSSTCITRPYTGLDADDGWGYSVFWRELEGLEEKLISYRVEQGAASCRIFLERQLLLKNGMVGVKTDLEYGFLIGLNLSSMWMQHTAALAVTWGGAVI